MELLLRDFATASLTECISLFNTVIDDGESEKEIVAALTVNDNRLLEAVTEKNVRMRPRKPKTFAAYGKPQRRVPLQVLDANARRVIPAVAPSH